jgi:hypothetical protein
MTEREWLAAENPDPLLTFFYDTASPRKLRLFGCACCRRVEHLTSIPEFIRTIDVVEQFADGKAAAWEMRATGRRAEQTFASQHAPGIHYRRADTATVWLSEEWWGTYFHPIESTRRVADAARQAAARDFTRRDFLPEPELAFATYPPTHDELMDYLRRSKERGDAEHTEDAQFGAIEATQQAALFRDIFGSPFRFEMVDPAWLTSTVVALAEGIYADRAFDRMPILADALQDAGCDNDDILNHWRDTSLTHVRGCWVIDLLTERT